MNYDKMEDTMLPKSLPEWCPQCDHLFDDVDFANNKLQCRICNWLYSPETGYRNGALDDAQSEEVIP